MEYDAEIQVSIGEYEFIKVCASGDDTESLVALARKVQNEVHGGEGLSETDFNTALDTYLENGTGVLDTYLRMNKEQQYVFQCIKRSIKRRKSK